MAEQLVIPNGIWSLREKDLAQFYSQGRDSGNSIGLQVDGTLRLSGVVRTFDDFRDWSPGRLSNDMHCVLAYPEVKFDSSRKAWKVGVRTIRLTQDESLYSLIAAVAFSEDPTFTAEVNEANLQSLISRSISLNPEHLSERLLLSAFRNLAHTAIVQHFYQPAMKAIPGVNIFYINPQHKKFRGTWHGYPFMLRISGRQARLNIWPKSEGQGPPAWHAHLSYPQPLPLWEQVLGNPIQAVHMLFSDIAPTIRPNTVEPPALTQPEFKVFPLSD